MKDKGLRSSKDKYLLLITYIEPPSCPTRDSHLDSYLACFGTKDMLSPKVIDPDRPPLLGCLFNVHGRHRPQTDLNSILLILI